MPTRHLGSLVLALCGAARADIAPLIQPPPPPPPPSSTPEPAAAIDARGLTITVDGTPVKLQSGAMVTLGTSAREVTLSTKPRPCSFQRLAERTLDDDEVTLTLRFHSVLGATDNAAWRAASAELRGGRALGDLSTITFSPIGSADRPASVTFAGGSLTAAEGAEQPAVEAALKGKAVVAGCGRRAPSTSLLPQPQRGLTLKAGAKALAVVGAIVESIPSGPLLRLSTSPLGCTAAEPADLTMTFELTPGETGVGVTAAGDALTRTLTLSAKAEAPGEGGGDVVLTTVTPPATKGEAVGVKLDAALALDGVAVRITGDVAALDCRAETP